MPGEATVQEAIHNRLKAGDLPFREFVELVLYDPDFGYYSQSQSPVGKAADFVTSASLSPVFSYGLGKLCRQFLSRVGDGVSQIVDVGAGEGALINSLRMEGATFFGIERGESLTNLPPADSRLVLSNELFDAQPFVKND